MYEPTATREMPRTAEQRPQVQPARVRPVRGPKPPAGWGGVVGMIVFAVIVAPIVIGLGAVYYVWSTAQVQDHTKTDAIVVLGAAQYNGTPSPVLRARLQHSLDLYNDGVAPRIITVGGKQSGDVYTEAEAGRQWLIAHGAAQDDVFAVKDGNDTLESLQDVAALAANNGWTSVTIDSDPAHIARAQAMANRLGFDVHGSPTTAGDGSSITDEYVSRETIAYLAFEIFGQWSVDRVVGT